MNSQINIYYLKFKTFKLTEFNNNVKMKFSFKAIKMIKKNFKFN